MEKKEKEREEEQRGRSYDKRRKRKKERVPFIQRSRRKKDSDNGTAECGGWLEMNRFTY